MKSGEKDNSLTSQDDQVPPGHANLLIILLWIDPQQCTRLIGCNDSRMNRGEGPGNSFGMEEEEYEDRIGDEENLVLTDAVNDCMEKRMISYL